MDTRDSHTRHSRPTLSAASRPPVSWIAILGCVVALTGTLRPETARIPPNEAEALPAGFVRGDVVSHSYVPIRTWAPSEGIGVLPYLFEYLLMKWSGKRPLEEFHEENVRRIDVASQWSTAIMLYARYDEWRDELIHLMIRCFRNRQLIVFRDYYEPRKDAEDPYHNLKHILEKLWKNRDTHLTSPEGDSATGRQLINNILACKCGDEGECGLGTDGLQKLFSAFDQTIRMGELSGEKPFRHIKAWYNMLGYAALDYNGCYASSQDDVDQYRRVKLPSNTQCIGVDVYHYWFPEHSPFDPADLSIPRERVRSHSDEWQRIRTRYYPEGLTTRVCEGSSDPSTWVPECWNDTHAILGAIELADAKDAMMWYIGVSGQLGPGDTITYTTPVETMESYYDHLKKGPWVALCWWTFGSDRTSHGGLEYFDRSLLHYTPEHPEGVPYSDDMLEYWRDEYVALKLRLFQDVVHGQFGHLNGPPPGRASGP